MAIGFVANAANYLTAPNFGWPDLKPTAADINTQNQILQATQGANLVTKSGFQASQYATQLGNTIQDLIAQGYNEAQATQIAQNQLAQSQLFGGAAGGMETMGKGTAKGVETLQGGIGAGTANITGGVSKGVGSVRTGAGEGVTSIRGGAAEGVGSIQTGVNQGVGLLQPYTSTGANAQVQLAALSGANGSAAQSQAINDLKNSPNFQALQAQAEDALLQNASATGGLRGGNTQRALATLAPSMLNDLINQQVSRLSALSSSGQSAATQAGQFQTAGGAQIGNLQASSGSQAGQMLAGAGSQAGQMQALGGYQTGQLVAGGAAEAGRMQREGAAQVGQLQATTGGAQGAMTSALGTNLSNLQTGSAALRGQTLSTEGNLAANLFANQNVGTQSAIPLVTSALQTGYQNYLASPEGPYSFKNLVAGKF